MKEQIPTLMVATEDMIIDVSCQKERTNWSFVRHIADNFDWELFQPLDIVRNGHNSYLVIDGQHRLLAARRAEIGSVPCRVHKDRGPAERSRIFLDLNEQRHGVNSRDRLRNRANSGDPRFVKAMRILRDHGLAVSKEDEGIRLTCAATVVAIVEKYGADRLRESLDFVVSTWGERETRRFQSWIVRGAADFLEYLWASLGPNGKQVDYERLTAAASTKIGNRFTLRDVITKAQERYPYRPHGAEAVCSALVDLYNWRRRSQRLPS